MTNYTVIRQDRKTISLYIDENLEVVVRAPKRIKDKDIALFVSKHEDWIGKALLNKSELKQKTDYLQTGTILYLGEYKELCITPLYLGKSKVQIIDNKLIIMTDKAQDKQFIRKLVEEFYREQAKLKLTYLTKQYADLVGVSYGKITIRKQKTRWGSCSSKGNIAYNVKLLCAPEEIIAYVVLHEVMHLKIFNHSKAFWTAVETVMPDYKRRMNELTQFGQNFSI